MVSSAEAAFRDSDLEGALTALQADLRAQPQNQEARVFLFQLMLVMGQWERALRQLNVLVEMNAQYALLAQTYRPLIACEAFRAEVFKGEKSPPSFGEPLPWFAPLIEAVRLTGAGEHEGAETLRGQAFEQAETTSGRIDDRPFAWIADADSRLGPVLEAVIQGRYFWIPFSRIQSVAFEKATDLRDFVWLPATFTWSNGGEAVGFVPTRYPGSESADAAALCLARTTTWSEISDGLALGCGQRMFATDSEDVGLLEIGRIDLDVEADNGEAGSADG